MDNENLIPKESTAIGKVASQAPSNFVGNFRECYKLAQVISQTEIIPETYRGKPADVAIAIDMADRMNISPMMVMQNLYVVKGKPTWSGQACKALIQGCGKFRNVRTVYFGEKNADGRGCYLSAEWADGTKIDGPEVTIKMAKAEGWVSKNPKWTNMPELMLAYRASAFFARVNCPEILMGVCVESEPDDIEKSEVIIKDVL